MTSAKHLVRKYLASDEEKPKAVASLESDLLDTVQSDSLNTTVQSALDLRKQGRIDQSIPLLTKANRKQMDAIKAVQRSIDALRGRRENEVIFAKYRQFYPFEMGIENGDDVLALLEDFALRSAPETDERRGRLHELEVRRHAECERLEFFEGRFDAGSEADTITEIRGVVRAIDEELLGIKHRILEFVLRTVEALSSEHSDQFERDRFTLSLSKWLYILVTSPTATRLADDVRTEP